MSRHLVRPLSGGDVHLKECAHPSSTVLHKLARLLALQRRLRVAGQRVALFTETALATFDGQLRFVRDETKLHLGSSIEACGSAVTAPAPGEARASVAVVQAVDASRFLSSLAGAHSGLVAAKMGRNLGLSPRSAEKTVSH